MTDKALEGVKVLDLGWHVAGPYCTKLLADYGAEVIKVERPGEGDPARDFGPFPDDKPNREASGLFFYLNNNKKSVTIDLKTASGISDLKGLVQWADIMVENFRPGVMANLGLDYPILQAINPRLVVTSISNFGQTGPYRDYKASDIVLQSLGMWTFYRGQFPREPLMAANGMRLSELVGGMFGATASMSALAYQRRTGTGQHVDVSLMEGAVQMNSFGGTAIQWPLSIWPPTRVMFTPGIEECQDGYIGLNIVTGQQWVDLCVMLDIPELIQNEEYALFANRMMHAQEIRGLMRPWLMARTREEILEECRDRRIPAAMIYSPADVVKSEIHRERQYLLEVQHPVLGKMKTLGAPCRMSETPWKISTPAPLLGQHNEEVSGHFGLGQETVRKTSGEYDASRSMDQPSEVKQLPLAGIRICDLTRFLAGPYATLYFGGLGAEVIKVESIQYVDGFRWPQLKGDRWWEGSAQWISVNMNKYDVTLDLNQPRGMELLKELIKKSDVIIDNFPPRVMENFGLTYPEVKALKEDIIMVSMPGYGMSGPWRDMGGFAMSFEQASGLAYLTGYSDGGPVNVGGAGDIITGIHTAFFIQAALEYRRRTGKGQFIEVSQLEVVTSCSGPAVIDYVMNNRVRGRMGNINLGMAPHGIYRCKEDDSWVAIAVDSDDRWQVFCDTIGKSEWISDERFSTLQGRKSNEEALSRLIGEWTAQYTPHTVMDILQQAGIAAGVVTTAEMVLNDPHLNDRGFWVERDRDVVGKLRYSKFPVEFSETPVEYRAAPTLGEDNGYVLGTVLGLTGEEIRTLEKEQIIGTEPLQTGLGV